MMTRTTPMAFSRSQKQPGAAVAAVAALGRPSLLPLRQQHRRPSRPSSRRAPLALRHATGHADAVVHTRADILRADINPSPSSITTRPIQKAKQENYYRK